MVTVIPRAYPRLTLLAADVVGYSRLMGADEAGTLAALKRHREAIFDPAVAAVYASKAAGLATPYVRRRAYGLRPRAPCSKWELDETRHALQIKTSNHGLARLSRKHLQRLSSHETDLWR